MENVSITPCLVNVRDVGRMLGISGRTVWKLLKNGQFPEPVRIGRSTRWRVSDVEEHIRKLAEERPERRTEA